MHPKFGQNQTINALKKDSPVIEGGISTAILGWLATRTDDAVLDPRKGYYPFDIIADAYHKGVEHGEHNLKEKVRKDFVHRASEAGTRINQLIKTLSSAKLIAKNLFVRIDFDSIGTIITVEEDLFLNDDIMSAAYTAVSKAQMEALDKKINLDIKFLIHKEGSLNHQSLQCDGFAIAMDLASGKMLY